MSAPWWCPVCHGPLSTSADARSMACSSGHSFDIARQGYVNLLGSQRRRASGDNAEMVRARRAFLATQAYEPLSDELSRICASACIGPLVLDVGCGEGYYTRRLADFLRGSIRMSAIDVSKPAVAAASTQHGAGYYAVASAFDVPVAPACVHLLVSVFGPIAAEEFARITQPGGAVVAVYPGARHLYSLRELVYPSAEPHEVKDPLRAAPELFEAVEVVAVTFPVPINSAAAAGQLLAMTPYRWHAPRDIHDRLERAGGLDTEVDVLISTYRRLSTP